MSTPIVSQNVCRNAPMLPPRGPNFTSRRLVDGGWLGWKSHSSWCQSKRSNFIPKPQPYTTGTRDHPAAHTADTAINPSAALQLIRAETPRGRPSGIPMLKQHFLRLTQAHPVEPPCQRHGDILPRTGRAARQAQRDAASLETGIHRRGRGELLPEKLKLLNHGLTFNGRALPRSKSAGKTKPGCASPSRASPDRSHTLPERRLQVLAMKRIRIGQVSMGKLPHGQWRYLMPQERF